MPSSLIDVIRQQVPTPVDGAPPADGHQTGLVAALSAVPDPRDPRGTRYPLASVLAMAVYAVLAGASTFAAIVDWAADLDPSSWTRLGFTGRIPVLSTVWRLLVRIEDQTLSAVLADWLRARSPARSPVGRRARMVIAVDGKLLRGARCPDGRQVHLLSAYDATAGLVLAQVQIACKSNEIPAFTSLLKQITAPTRRPGRRDHRKETCTVKALTVRTPGGIRFPHAQQTVRIIRTRTIAGKVTRETAYLVVSLPGECAQPADLADWVRREWHIENRLHWIRDVTFGGDAHQAAPAPEPPWPRSYATPPSDSTAATARPTSPAPTADPPTSSTP